MNDNYQRFVAFAHRMAVDKGVPWELTPSTSGKLSSSQAWELNTLCGIASPPRRLLTDLGTDQKSLGPLNKRMVALGQESVEKVVLSVAWQELIKAAIMDQLFVHGNTPNHTLGGVVRPLRVLATCAVGSEPWELSTEHVALARDVAQEVQPSGQLARLVNQVTRHLIDYHHLADRCPLLPASERRRNRRASQKIPKRIDPRRQLAERKASEKLPETHAFWELVRIIFTESPKTFLDEIRFAQVKLLILCGLRIGEICMMPLNWKRHRDYVDLVGRPAGEAGGISQSLMLRYFAEKRFFSDEKGFLLYPEVQHIPPLFEEPLQEALSRVALLTSPLRKRLQAQVESGRIFPEFEIYNLVPVTELYVYLSGNPFIYHDPLEEELIKEYKESFDVEVLYRIRERQDVLGNQKAELRNEVRIYWARMRRGCESALPFRLADGSLLSRGDYRDGCFRIDELESFIRLVMPTKLSDIEGFRATTGAISTYDLLFLTPKRSLGEERNGGICDVTRYVSIGRVTPEDLIINFGGGQKKSSIYSRYGRTNEDKNLSVDSHSFRHLQNTELFRLGIADTIITKRFGRKSVTQSYEYDHRSLAEELDSIEIPSQAMTKLEPKAQQVFRMISTGRVKGLIVDEFKRIQKEQGDDSAFEFLAAEADGFHTTPYGFCINSFTVDPCPKHLECYNGCRHLSTTELPEHRINLERVRDQLEVAIKAIEARPSESVGRTNQLAHARTRLENLQKILASPLGGRPFPDGHDLSEEVISIQGSLLDG